MLANILSWLMAIPKAIAGIKDIIDSVRGIFDFIEANKNEKWFQQSAEVFATLQKAKTSEEKREAAKKIRDLLGSF